MWNGQHSQFLRFFKDNWHFSDNIELCRSNIKQIWEGVRLHNWDFPRNLTGLPRDHKKMGVDCFPIADNLFPFPNLRRLAIYNNYHTLSHTGYFWGICIKPRASSWHQLNFLFPDDEISINLLSSLPWFADIESCFQKCSTALSSARSAGQPDILNRSMLTKEVLCTVNNAVY